jgi:putative transcriptional regulator
MPGKSDNDKTTSQHDGGMDWAAFDALTPDEVMAAALSDPDAQPWPEGKPMRRIARAKFVRFKLRMTEQEFADRYHIPLATLKAWERHEAIPDAVALAYLGAIEADPEGVAKAVAVSQRPAQAAE